MFIVTWGHCAQCVSGNIYPELFGKPGVLIAFHMPLFMMISGYFVNPSRIRQKKWNTFVSDKFLRLMIPSVTWYAFYCIIFSCVPSLMGALYHYWFLSSLFFSLVIVCLVVKINKDDNPLLYLISTLVIVVFPGSSFLHINFMYPLIISGYLFRILLQRHNGELLKKFAVLFFGLSVALLLFWDVKYSVYISPFEMLHVSQESLFALCIRMLTGFIVSAFFILLFMLIENYSFVKNLSRYGQYTLVMYTASFFLNGIMRNVLNHYHFHIVKPWMLEISSCIWCLIVCAVCILLAMLLERRKWTKKLFLGAFNN